MFGEHRILLIGGSSHVGKSTLAQSLASHLGWNYRSTDKLARYPGRPWQAKPKKVPNHVADHHLLLATRFIMFKMSKAFDIQKGLSTSNVKENDCTHLAWNADARNTRGLRFYNRLGAEITEQHSNRCLLRWVPWAAA